MTERLDLGPCEAGEWDTFTGQKSGPCPNRADHMEFWFDEEGVEVKLCPEHGDGERPAHLCPDGGTCHHECREPCWRRENAAPLAGVFPGDAWPGVDTSQPTRYTASMNDTQLSAAKVAYVNARQYAEFLQDQISRLQAELRECEENVTRRGDVLRAEMVDTADLVDQWNKFQTKAEKRDVVKGFQARAQAGR